MYLHNPSLVHATHDELRVGRPLQPLHRVKASLETENLQRFGISDHHAVLTTACNVLSVRRKVAEVASLLEKFREVHAIPSSGSLAPFVTMPYKSIQPSSVIY